jgi:hypothetical protein
MVRAANERCLVVAVERAGSRPSAAMSALAGIDPRACRSAGRGDLSTPPMRCWNSPARRRRCITPSWRQKPQGSYRRHHRDEARRSPRCSAIKQTAIVLAPNMSLG